MIDCGPQMIEVTSFVNPKAVPQMAGAADVVTGVKHYAAEKGVEILALTLNKRGVENAREAGCKFVEFVVSVSAEHNQRNPYLVHLLVIRSIWIWCCAFVRKPGRWGSTNLVWPIRLGCPIHSIPEMY